MNDLNTLNPQQLQAVTAPLGQTLILAGPGSGKTRVLTFRIAHLIQDIGVSPFNILAVTFTNKAAREMTRRLELLLGGHPGGMWLGTFHANCARILRREADYLPVDQNYVIFDADDQTSLVKRIIKELNINDKQYKPGSVLAAISDAKNNMIAPKEIAVKNYRDEVVKRVYERYQEVLRSNNAVDFDDLLLLVVQMFQEHPLVRENYARRFEQVLVDEFQDTNSVQYELVKLLASYHKNIFVVGDEDQSIYRWRGADYKNVLRFMQDYPDAQKILLEQNYRSTQTVLDAAREVIDRNEHRTPKKLFTERGYGAPVVLYEAQDDRAEAQYIVDAIQLATQSRKAKAGDFAIMYRTNAQSRLLEEAFLHAGVPYRLVGAQRFYGRREVKDIIAYLRLIFNPKDEVSLLRVIKVPPRGIGDKTIAELQFAANQVGISAGEVLLDLAEMSEESLFWKQLGRSAIPLARFGTLLENWKNALAEKSLPELFDQILLDIDYQNYIADASEEETTDRWDNVQELRRLAVEYQERGLNEFLENLALVSDQDTVPENIEAPTLLTLHAAKGLEFSQVFITGLDEGLLPHSRSLYDDEEMAEERRLFYVGMTRAKDQLYLVRAQRRGTYGVYEDQLPSRFIRDIPLNLLVDQSPRLSSSSWGGSYGNQHGNHGRLKAWDATDDSDLREYNRIVRGLERQSATLEGYSTPVIGKKKSPEREEQTPVKPKKSTPQYKPGMRVKHATWGEGMVLLVHLEGDGEETLEVFFESVGKKRLAASLAKLEILT